MNICTQGALRFLIFYVSRVCAIRFIFLAVFSSFILSSTQKTREKRVSHPKRNRMQDRLQVNKIVALMQGHRKMSSKTCSLLECHSTFFCVHLFFFRCAFLWNGYVLKFIQNVLITVIQPQNCIASRHANGKEETKKYH